MRFGWLKKYRGWYNSQDGLNYETSALHTSDCSLHLGSIDHPAWAALAVLEGQLPHGDGGLSSISLAASATPLGVRSRDCRLDRPFLDGHTIVSSVVGNGNLDCHCYWAHLGYIHLASSPFWPGLLALHRLVLYVWSPGELMLSTTSGQTTKRHARAWGKMN